MSANNKKSKTATRSHNKVKRAAKKSAPMTASHARAISRGLASRAKRFVSSNPLRILLGTAAMAVVAAKLKQRFA